MTDPQWDPPFATRPRDLILFALVWSALLAGLAWIAGEREGSHGQWPAWESADYLADAIRIRRAIVEGGARGFAEAWAHTSSQHTPLVPTISALLMLPGESRGAAEAAQPLLTFLLCLSVAGLARRLYPASRWTPFAAAALLTTFPIVVNQSRVYLFEHALAAFSAASLWALAASDRLTRLAPSLAFGVLAGLAGLARSMGFALLVGPVAVGLAAAFREGPRARKLLHFALATTAGTAVAMTWYAPNLPVLLQYLRQVTYGELAVVHAGAGSGVSLANAKYALEWNVLDGAGVPILGIAALAWAAACARARRWIVSPTMAALALAWSITAFVLLLASQAYGATLFLAAMWMQALAVTRALALLRPPGARTAASAVVALFALYHLCALTFSFPMGPGGRVWPGPFGVRFPWWNHTPHFLSLWQAANANPWHSYPVGDVVDRARAGPLPPAPSVVLVTQHPFFSDSTLRLEVLRRRLDWNCPNVGYLPASLSSARRDAARRTLLDADFLVVRTNVGFTRTDSDEVTDRIVSTVTEGPRSRFVRDDPPLALPDGSEARLFRRRFEVEVVPRAALPESGPVDAAPPVEFRSPEGSRTLTIASWEGLRSPKGANWQSLRIRARLDPPGGFFPDLRLVAADPQGRLKSVRVDARRRWIPPAPPGLAGAHDLALDYALDPSLPIPLRIGGFRLYALVVGDTPGVRWKVRTPAPTEIDEHETRAFLGILGCAPRESLESQPR